MAESRDNQARSSSGDAQSRPVDLVGDSAELVAFALLRYLAQIEQKQANIKLDRAWLLDAYAECLVTVKGERAQASGASKSKAGRR